MCLHSRCLVTASNGGRFPCCGYPNYLRAPVTSLSQQQLTRTEPWQSSNSLTHSLTNQPAPLHSLTVLLITSRHGLRREHRFYVAYAVIGADHAENTAFQPVHWRVLGIFA
jgi:hypothetical protein